MALNLRAPKPEPILAVRPFAEDPEATRLTALRDHLRRGIQQRQNTLTLYAVRNELKANSSLASGPRKERLRQQEKALQAKAPSPQVTLVPAGGQLHPDVELALRLADGGEIELPKDETAHKQHLRAEMLTIERGLAQVSQQFAELHEARSVEVYEQHLRQHRAVLTSKYEAVLALVAACDAERGMISAMIIAGYQHMPGIWTSPPLDQAARLGTLAEWDSPVSTFKRTLETLKVI